MASNKEKVNEELPPDKFAEKFTRLIDDASVSMAMGVGDELGIFSVMAQMEKPETSEVIAKKSGLVERYIRELLAVLVTGKIIHYFKEESTYFLPRSYIPYLTTGKTNMAMYSSLLIKQSNHFGELCCCFKNGGGIPYSSYKEFHAWMDEFSSKRHETDLMDVFLPTIEGLQEKLESGIKVLDVGCGSGSPGLIMAAAFPKSEFHGFDISEEAIKKAKEEAERRSLTNSHFKVQDCANIGSEYNEYFDYVTAFDTIHDQAYPDTVLAEMFKVLKRDGLFSLVDSDAHSNLADNVGLQFLPFRYVTSLFQCLPVSLYFEGGKGLGTCWGRENALDMLKSAGFIGTEEVFSKSYNFHIVSSKQSLGKGI